jgi:hypothetical protein
MARQKSHVQLVDSVSLSATSKPVHCFDPQAQYVDVAYTLDVTAANLVGTLTLVGGAEPDAATMYPLTTAALLSPAVSGAAYASGVVTFSTVAIGTARGLLRVVDPPPYVAAVYVYTSGGGTNRARVKAVY